MFWKRHNDAVSEWCQAKRAGRGSCLRKEEKEAAEMSYSKKTYSRKGGGGKGNPFDRMMKEQCNKPVAAKSAGIVGE